VEPKLTATAGLALGEHAYDVTSALHENSSVKILDLGVGIVQF
jgi:hypothetical protein